jgi:hypothetical protein
LEKIKFKLQIQKVKSQIPKTKSRIPKMNAKDFGKNKIQKSIYLLLFARGCTPCYSHLALSGMCVNLR